MNKGKQNGKSDHWMKSSRLIQLPISRGIGEWFGLHWSVRKFNSKLCGAGGHRWTNDVQYQKSDWLW